MLPDRDFVQMAETAPIKFKSSVARGLHLLAQQVPNWNMGAWSRGTASFLRRNLPLTMVNGAGFNPDEAWGTIQWLTTQT